MTASREPRHRIAVIAGDGVGPEVIAEAVRLLDAVAEAHPEAAMAFDHFDWGTDRYHRTGAMMPEDGIETLRPFDAILLGAVGHPSVPDHVTLRGLLIPIRSSFDLYVNLRPARLLRGIPTPLADRKPGEIDILFVREGTEGEYAGIGGRLYQGTEREVALQTAVFTRKGVERVVRWSFELAVREGRSVTSVSKGNALQYSAVLWDEVFDLVAAEYPAVPTRRLLVDAAAMFMVRNPGEFEVVVGSNLFGDILTDLSAALIGGMGIAASANLDPTHRNPSMFEPVHGSAPDIAGKGVANPVGAIWSAALMLDHLGHPELGARIVDAIERAIGDAGVRTRDLGGTATTREMADAVIAAFRSQPA